MTAIETYSSNHKKQRSDKFISRRTNLCPNNVSQKTHFSEGGSDTLKNIQKTIIDSRSSSNSYSEYNSDSDNYSDDLSDFETESETDDESSISGESEKEDDENWLEGDERYIGIGEQKTTKTEDVFHSPYIFTVIDFKYQIEEEINKISPSLHLDSKVNQNKIITNNFEEINKTLVEINAKWLSDFESTPSKKHNVNNKKIVNFKELNDIFSWDDNEESRKGPWEQIAMDKARFKKRIQETSKLISNVLTPKHRLKIFERLQNFTNSY